LNKGIKGPLTKQDGFLDENRDVLRAGLEGSPWISVDYTGARHKAKNGFCTQIGNDRFTWFDTRSSKSRLNFLDPLRAGYADYVLNDLAFDYMRGRGLAALLIACLTEADERHFVNPALWHAHLDRLSIVRRQGPMWGLREWPRVQMVFNAARIGGPGPTGTPRCSSAAASAPRISSASSR
jgi:hypothetical protein